MPKYHDQKKIHQVIASFKGLTADESKKMKKFFIQEQMLAKCDVQKISVYTTPEDANSRREVLYYYTDIIEGMGWGPNTKEA